MEINVRKGKGEDQIRYERYTCIVKIMAYWLFAVKEMI